MCPGPDRASRPRRTARAPATAGGWLLGDEDVERERPGQQEVADHEPSGADTGAPSVRQLRDQAHELEVHLEHHECGSTQQLADTRMLMTRGVSLKQSSRGFACASGSSSTTSGRRISATAFDSSRGSATDTCSEIAWPNRPTGRYRERPSSGPPISGRTSQPSAALVVQQVVSVLVLRAMMCVRWRVLADSWVDGSRSTWPGWERG
jgi:hypothetical protein